MQVRVERLVLVELVVLAENFLLFKAFDQVDSLFLLLLVVVNLQSALVCVLLLTRDM
jgi:hypothetical protein